MAHSAVSFPIAERPRGRTVLLIADDERYRSATARMIGRDGHAVIAAARAREGLEVLRTREVDLVVVDERMPDMTVERFVGELRAFDPYVQVVLQTGRATANPRELLRRLAIQGHHDESDGPDALLLAIDVALKAANTVRLLKKSRQGLRYILDATPELQRIQPLESLFKLILMRTAGLLGVVDGFVAVAERAVDAPDECIVMVDDDDALTIRAATGRFERPRRVIEGLVQTALDSARRAIRSRRTEASRDGTTTPLRVGDRVLGALYVGRALEDSENLELLDVFASQAAVAIENVTLYEMAAIDSLTGVHGRRFFQRALLREIRGAWRTGAPLGLLIVDLDDMKGINDGFGHELGDRALVAAGETLRAATRASDVVGRLGGDEFAVLLPRTDAGGVEVVLRRVVRRFDELTIRGPSAPLRVRASVGSAVLRESDQPPRASHPRAGAALFERVAARLVCTADAAMYRRKRDEPSDSGHDPLGLRWDRPSFVPHAC